MSKRVHDEDLQIFWPCEEGAHKCRGSISGIQSPLNVSYAYLILFKEHLLKIDFLEVQGLRLRVYIFALIQLPHTLASLTTNSDLLKASNAAAWGTWLTMRMNRELYACINISNTHIEYASHFRHACKATPDIDLVLYGLV